MNVQKAIALVMKTYPTRIPIGYWVKKDKIIINTKPPKGCEEIDGAAQFVVTPKGDVYGTSPLNDDIDVKTMKHIVIK